MEQRKNLTSPISIKEIFEKCSLLIGIFFGCCTGYGVMTFRFLTTSGTQNNDKSYHEQSMIGLSCGGKFVKIFPVVFLQYDVKRSVSFLFAFSIY